MHPQPRTRLDSRARDRAPADSEYSGAACLGWYALRRSLRIPPAYGVALTLFTLWPGLDGVFIRDGWVYYGVLQSYRSDCMFQGIVPTWRLSVGRGFDAVLPLLAAELLRAGQHLDTRGHFPLQIIALASLGAVGVAFRAAAHHAGHHDVGTMLPAYLLWFSLGMIFAVLNAWLEGREGKWWPARWVAANRGWSSGLAAALFFGWLRWIAVEAPALALSRSIGARSTLDEGTSDGPTAELRDSA